SLWSVYTYFVFFFSSRRRHTRFSRDWSSDVCSSDLVTFLPAKLAHHDHGPGRVRRAFHRVLRLAMRFRWATIMLTLAAFAVSIRSEERRVGKEGRSRVWR